MTRNVWMGWLAGVLLAALPCSLHAQVSLSTVVELAQKHSAQVRMAEADVRKSQAVYSQTKDVFVPSMNFSSGLPAAPSVGFMGGTSSIFTAAAQALVFSLPYKNYLKAGSSGVRAAQLSLKDAREQVALDASTAYIELDTVMALLASAREQEKYALRLTEIQQARAEAGLVPISDLLQTKLTCAEIHLKTLHLETRAETLSEQLSTLTGLPVGSIISDHASIPEIPAIKAQEEKVIPLGVQAAQSIAKSKQLQAKGDKLYEMIPQMSFGAQYNRHTTLLNNEDDYYRKPIPINNFSAGFSIQVPLFDWGHRSKARETAADALRSTVEVEQAQRQNEVQVSLLTGTLRELNTMAEIASLKQQIADAQLKTIRMQLESGSSGSGASQLTPKDEQLALIDERQKYSDALEAGFDLSKTRLSLLRVLGHMQDWLAELH